MALDYVEARQANHPTGYRSTRGLTIAILILLCVHVLVSVALSLLWPSVSRVVGWGDESVMGFAAAAAFTAFFYAQSTVFIACATCFLCWLYRANANLPSLGSERLTLTTPRKAVTGWFIPFFNLVHGYRSVREVYLESQRPAVLPDGVILPTQAPLVGWWWGFWIARNVGQNLFGNYWMGTALDIAAAVLCMLVVYRVDKRQRDQHDDLVRQTLVPVPTGATLR